MNYTKFRAPNGMNLSKSMSNPNSRANRLLNYLRSNGPATRAEILRDVFNIRVIPNAQFGTRVKGRATRGWGAYLFSLLVKNRLVTKTRVSNRVYYRAV